MNRIGNLTQLICTLLYVMTTHAYVYIVACTLNSRLLSGHLGVVAARFEDIFSPSAMAHATPCSVPGYSYFRMCSEKSERDCLTSYLYNAVILASFFYSRV